MLQHENIDQYSREEMHYNKQGAERISTTVAQPFRLICCPIPFILLLPFYFPIL